MEKELEHMNLVGSSTDVMLDHIFDCHDKIRELKALLLYWDASTQ